MPARPKKVHFTGCEYYCNMHKCFSVYFPCIKQSAGSDDYRMVQESLRNLRSTFGTGEHHHNTIDQLECSIASLVEKLHMSESSQKVKSLIFICFSGTT